MATTQLQGCSDQDCFLLYTQLAPGRTAALQPQLQPQPPLWPALAEAASRHVQAVQQPQPLVQLAMALVPAADRGGTQQQWQRLGDRLVQVCGGRRLRGVGRCSVWPHCLLA